MAIGLMEVQLVKAKGLQETDIFAHMDPYVLLQYKGQDRKSSVIHGAVMFLFEGKFGNILHTGDCRLAPECLLNLSDKYVGRKGKEPRCPLDCVFLDCTFGNFSQGMPSKHSAIQQRGAEIPYGMRNSYSEWNTLDQVINTSSTLESWTRTYFLQMTFLTRLREVQLHHSGCSGK